MPTVTLRLDIDPSNGRRTIVISYASDADALPVEHEEEHRAIVGKLLEGGLVKPGDGILVERQSEGPVAAARPPAPEAPAPRSVEEKS